MKFTCDRSVLLDGINKVKNAASTNSQIEELRGVLIEAFDVNQSLRFMATDSELAIQCTAYDIDVVRGGSVLVSAKILFDVVKSLSGVLTVETDKSNLLIHYGESVVTLKTLDPDNFPGLPLINGQNLKIGSGAIKTALQKTMYAMSRIEDRPVFNATLFKLHDKKLNIVATDTFRLALYTLEAESNQEFEAIVPRRTVKELFRLIGKEELPIKITYSGPDTQNIQFSFESVSILSRLAHGIFPNYQQVIPDTHTAQITSKTSALRTAIKRAVIFTDCYHRTISINGCGERITVSASQSLFGSIEEKISAEHSGDEFKITLGSEFMLQALSSISGEQVTIDYVDPYQPITMKEKNFTQIILPVRVSA